MFNGMHATKLWARRRTEPRRYRPVVESLEARWLMSGNSFLQTNLVSDLPGVAKTLDPQLVNPWGISESGTSPFWVSDNNAGVSTLYNTTGDKQGLVVGIPTPVDTTGSSGTPTGTVFNTGANAFNLTGDTNHALFLFATEDGTIVGWNPAVLPKEGVIKVDNSGNNFTNPDPAQETGAVYKGLAIAHSTTPIIPGDANSTDLLYAANFRTGTVDVFDSKFAAVTTGGFVDPNLPKGYAPFNVQTLGGKIYVTYAKQDKFKADDVAGPGHGFVDVFNLDGSPGLDGGKVRLISRGPLNSPWGLAIAPATFGSFGGDLLVGNFGNGKINAFDPTSGAFLGQLQDPDGEPFQVDGLSALQFGNGGNGGVKGTLYFTAGLADERHGLFGSLTPVDPDTDEGPAEQQMVQAALDVFQLDLTQLQQDLAAHAPRATIIQDIQTLHTDLRDLVRAERRALDDTLRDQGLRGEHHGHDDGDFDAMDAVFAGLGHHGGHGFDFD